MIYIKKNFTNRIILELSSINTNNTYFLFEFIPEWTLDQTPRYFSNSDNSLAPQRYNDFTLIESSAGITGSTVTGQAVNLASGQYRYNVYGSSNMFGSPIAPSGPVISTGRMFVDGFGLGGNSVYS